MGRTSKILIATDFTGSSHGTAEKVSMMDKNLIATDGTVAFGDAAGTASKNLIAADASGSSGGTAGIAGMTDKNLVATDATGSSGGIAGTAGTGNAVVISKRKANRARRIPKPDTPEDMFIMFGDVTKKAEKVKDSLIAKRAVKTELEQELIAMPEIYVKSLEELNMIEALYGFQGELFVGVDVDDNAINGFVQKHVNIRVTRKVMVFNNFP